MEIHSLVEWIPVKNKTSGIEQARKHNSNEGMMGHLDWYGAIQKT